MNNTTILQQKKSFICILITLVKFMIFEVLEGKKKKKKIGPI